MLPQQSRRALPPVFLKRAQGQVFSDLAVFGKRMRVRAGDDDVVENADINHFERAADGLGKQMVCLAKLGLATRMVMHKYSVATFGGMFFPVVFSSLNYEVGGGSRLASQSRDPLSTKCE